MTLPAIPKRILSLTGVAVEVPKLTGVTRKKVAGMEVPEPKTGLTELNVLLPSNFDVKGTRIWFEPGMKIYVSTQAVMAFPWGKEIFTIDDKTFVVVPVEFVVAFQT